MIHMRLEYDADKKIFKLIDRNLSSMFENGAVYDVALQLQLTLEGVDGDGNLISLDLGPLAHA